MISVKLRFTLPSCIILFLLLIGTSLKAQVIVNGEASIYGITNSSDRVMPHYLHTNTWGLVSPLDESSVYMQAKAKVKAVNNWALKLDFGLSGVGKNDWDESFLQEAYVRAKFFNTLDLSIGKEAYSPLVGYEEPLSTGNFLMNTNAQPIPRITAGLYNYTKIPYVNWLEIKGGLSHGILNDDRTAENKSNSADKPLLLEQWAYLRAGSRKIKLSAGLVHSAIFGGTRPNGDEIPIDYWATFFAKSSSDVSVSDATNAAGAHEGFWDFGLDLNFEDLFYAKIYYQKPFADGSGMRLTNFKNRDYKLGFDIKPYNIKWLSNINIELIRTDWQSGAGLADPLYPTDYDGHNAGDIIWEQDVGDDLDGFMHDVFGVNQTGWTWNECMDYMEDNINEGYPFGGRDNYNNNGFYYNSWSYNKQNIGYPLYQSYYQASEFAPNWDMNNSVIFINNRIRAFHIGASGAISRQFNYAVRATYTRNMGAYTEQYISRESWEPVENYYFTETKTQLYSSFNVDYTPYYMNNLKASLTLAVDCGQMYRSTAVMLGLTYSIF